MKTPKLTYEQRQARKLQQVLRTDGFHGSRALCPALRLPVYVSNSWTLI